MVYLGDEPLRVDVLQERMRQKMEGARRQAGVPARRRRRARYQELMEVFDTQAEGSTGVDNVPAIDETSGNASRPGENAR